MLSILSEIFVSQNSGETELGFHRAYYSNRWSESPHTIVLRGDDVTGKAARLPTGMVFIIPVSYIYIYIFNSRYYLIYCLLYILHTMFLN